MTFMNLSGEAVSAAARFYKISPGNILVICDDITLSPGVVRIRSQGSHGGHNGLRNITDHLGSQAFPRIRVGVGQKPHPDYDLVDWVTGVPPDADAKAIRSRAPDIAAAAELILEGKLELAQSRYNGA